MKICWLPEFIQRITKAYSTSCKPICEKFDISRISFDILLFLANNPQFYTAKDVSRYRNLKPNVVSVHVEQLVKDGYLLRESVAEDRRKVRLRYTPKAEAVILQGQQMQKAFHRHLLEGLSREDIEIFRSCFEKMMENAGNLPDSPFV